MINKSLRINDQLGKLDLTFSFGKGENESFTSKMNK